MACGNVPVRVARSVIAKFRADFKDWNVDFKFDHKNEFLDGETAGEAGAYFQIDEQPIIRVSTVNRPVSEWLYNFIHETCHLDQWMNDDPTWYDLTERHGGIDCADLANLWINHEIELTATQRHGIFYALYDNELDAERRAIKKLHELKIAKYYDIGRLCQENFAYINEYLVAKDSRYWIPAEKRPYDVEEIVKAQPTSMAAYHGELSPYWDHYLDARLGKIALEMSEMK